MLWKKRIEKKKKLNRTCGILLLCIVCILGVLAGMRIDAMAAYEPETVSGNETGMLTDEVKTVLAQVNEARAEIGLTELVWNEELAKAADIRAKEIEQIFSHVRPDGSEWWTVNDEVIYGENIARGYQNADSVMEAWMKSSEHKDNILYASFQTIGIALYESNGQWYWVQVFGY